MDTHTIGDRWVTWMRAQSWSETTITDRISFIGTVERRTDADPVSLTVDDILDFLASRGIENSSRRTYYLWLKSWFTWAVEAGLRADNPTDEIAVPRAGRRPIRILDPAHVAHLLASRLRRRTRAMILLAAYQGLRVSEIARVAGRDFDLLSNELTVTGKGDVRAYLPLHPIVRALAEQQPRGWWFPSYVDPARPIRAESVSEAVGGAMKRAGIPGTAHSLRHWYAMELLRQGVDLKTIQKLMRHASLATTEQYLNLDDARAHAAVLRLPDLTTTPPTLRPMEAAA